MVPIKGKCQLRNCMFVHSNKKPVTYTPETTGKVRNSQETPPTNTHQGQFWRNLIIGAGGLWAQLRSKTHDWTANKGRGSNCTKTVANGYRDGLKSNLRDSEVTPQKSGHSDIGSPRYASGNLCSTDSGLVEWKKWVKGPPKMVPDGAETLHDDRKPKSKIQCLLSSFGIIFFMVEKYSNATAGTIHHSQNTTKKEVNTPIFFCPFLLIPMGKLAEIGNMIFLVQCPFHTFAYQGVF
ncbi:hypothetical protein AMTR_s00061p00088840 [Amborella trichopoda]|uniref:Uncharacterized protein n=1 Tax=Amborella trichopoda TaxID=13333 RepID=U5D0E4_AMBTC|nr:hypothetical protein AMTR_s00061p00088840 [Amborella trichopoda]